MKHIKNLFLEEQPSIGLSLFRLFVALTVGLQVMLVWQIPDALLMVVAGFFYLTWFCFLIGLFAQISCIAMTACCYYLYTFNALPIDIFSWGMVLVTLLLMGLTAYHGDYFSLDALRRGDVNAYHRQRPFVIQRLLQLQAVVFFLIALYAMTGSGKWLLDNPLFFLLFSAQLMLFIHPSRIVGWIESRRRLNEQSPRPCVIYDNDCAFCCSSIVVLQIMDLWGRLNYIPGPKGLSEMAVEMPDGKKYGGFFAFRRLSWMLPMLWVLIPFVYLPGAGIIGSLVYRWIARHRYLFAVFHSSSSKACHR